ncbi:MAG: phosphoribosyl-AMP cyclohydrolase [Ruminococcus sp.]
MLKIDINDLDKYFQKGELIPAIAFDVDTKTVLMLAYMNKESLRKTLETGYTWYWAFSSGTVEQGATSAICKGHLHLQRLRR